MLPGKRSILAASVLLATMTLFGCARTVEGQEDPAGTAVPVNADVSASPSPTASPVGITLTTLAAASIPKMGEVVTDEKGWVLYRFDKDSANPSASTCEGKCAEVWPPMLSDNTPTLQGVAPDKVGMVRRADGGMQVTLGGWPLYRYIGDAKPGQWKGQGVNGTWYVAAPDGSKNLTCVPSGTPTAVAPPASSAPTGAATSNNNNGGGGYQY